MGNPIRVLHVVVNMNRGGAETLIMNLYRNVDRSKVQFDFLTCRPGVFDEEIIKMGGRIHRIPYISDVGPFKYQKSLRRFFSDNPDYQVIHSHLDKMSGLVLREANEAGIPFRIAHIHSTGSEGGLISRAYKWYSGKLLPVSTTHVIACSKKAAAWICPNGVEQTAIIKNGIESEKFTFSENIRKKVREDFGIKKEVLVLGHIGRFWKVKNHDFLIDIFAKFNRDRKDSILILVGDGPLKSEIEKKVKKLNLEGKVIFTGIRGDSERLLQAFDLFIFPSLYEGLPVSLIEAQGAGLPCIISDNISTEVDLNLGLIHYAPLDDQEIWMEKIRRCGLKSQPRIVNRNVFLKKGYDIKSSATYLEGFYLALLR